MKKYDTIITLSNDIDLDGNVKGLDVGYRVEKSVDLRGKGYSDILTMSGNHGSTDKDAIYTQAEAMKRYAIELGVPERYILKEEYSLDTISQAVFVREKVLVPNNFGDIIVLSSDYHMDRIEKIFDLILGNDFDINFIGVYTDLSGDSGIIESEHRKTRMFFDLFRDVKKGDIKDIIERLFSEHELYKGIPGYGDLA
jgi:uncharacterized SAM-binding protein YcdF (DUF218 family)